MKNRILRVIIIHVVRKKGRPFLSNYLLSILIEKETKKISIELIDKMNPVQNPDKY